MHQTNPTIFSPEWLEQAEVSQFLDTKVLADRQSLTIAGNEWTPEQLQAVDKMRASLAIVQPENMRKLLDTVSLSSPHQSRRVRR